MQAGGQAGGQAGRHAACTRTHLDDVQGGVEAHAVRVGSRHLDAHRHGRRRVVQQRHHLARAAARGGDRVRRVLRMVARAKNVSNIKESTACRTGMEAGAEAREFAINPAPDQRAQSRT